HTRLHAEPPQKSSFDCWYTGCLPCAAWMALHRTVPGDACIPLFCSATRVGVMPMAPSVLALSGEPDAFSTVMVPSSAIPYFGWNPCCSEILVKFAKSRFAIRYV